MANNGTDYLLYINTGTVGSPVWTAAGSQKNLTIGKTADILDASHKADTWEVALQGRRHSTVDLDALFVPTDAALVALQAAFNAQLPILIRKYFQGNAVEQADSVISDLTENLPDNEISTVRISLRVTGGWGAPS